MKKLIIANRTNTKALKSVDFENKDTFTNWKNSVENLRLSVSNYAVANRINADQEAITECTNEVFTAYNSVLSFFTNKSVNEKVKAQATDLNSLLTFIGANRKERNSEDGKQFLPVGSITFRKSVEDFISDRITSAHCKTAEDIETERKERNEAKKLAKKAKKQAEKATTKTAETVAA